MVREIDIFATLDVVKVFIDKAITSLTLLKKELESETIDLNFAYSYLCEAQGYLNILHKQVSYWGKNIELIKRTTEEIANDKTSS